MKVPRVSSAGRALRLALVLVGVVSPLKVAAADTAPLRLAVGPFFAPVASEKLQQASKLLPELLLAELSHQSRFQLIERAQVQSVFNELNLTASGLVARDSVARLGRVLACDWLVSGTLAQSGGRNVVWTKVIDIRNGVVLDLNATPYDGADIAGTIPDIAKFLSQAGRATKARKFIAMGPFVDMNPQLDSAREDWAKRFSSAIEKHFHDAGFGIVEMGAVAPIFEERRLEAAGLTGHSEQRVKLQAAFWLLDGGCEWATNAAGQLSVGLRVQRVGGPEQIFRLITSADTAGEQTVMATIAKALTDVRQVAPELSANAEADLLHKRGMELARRESPFRPSTDRRTKLTGTENVLRMEDQLKRGEESRNTTFAAYERTLLLDPKNLDAKVMLGYGLLGDSDAGKRERGKTMLREVVAANDPTQSPRADRHLKAADWLFATAEKGRHSALPSTDQAGLEKTVAADPADWRAKYELGALLMASLAGSDRGRAADLLSEVMEKAPADLAAHARTRMPEWALARHARKQAAATASAAAKPAPDKGTNMLFFKFPEPEKIGFTLKMTAAGVLPPRGFLVAAGTELHHYNVDDRKFQKLELPADIRHTITGIMADRETIWLGTDGGGIVQLSHSGVMQRQFGVSDGLLSPHVKAISLFGGRLWIGFGSSEGGGIGYLETTSGKFVALTSPELSKSRNEVADGPPVASVHAIKTADFKTVWVASASSLKRFHIESSKWSTVLPFGPQCVSVASTFAAASSPTGGVLVCEFTGNTWTNIPLVRDARENVVQDLRAEGRRIWIGSPGAVHWIDVSDGEVIGGCAFTGSAARWVYPNPDYIWFVADAVGGGASELRRFQRRPSHVLQARLP